MKAVISQTGSIYNNDMAIRKNVNWSSVNLADESWNNQQTRLILSEVALLLVDMAWKKTGRGATKRLVMNSTLSSFSAQADINFVKN